MTLTVELPSNVQLVYLAQVRARGLPLDELLREVLIANQPAAPGAIGQGLGLFGSPEDSALLDEADAMAYEDRHHPSNRI